MARRIAQAPEYMSEEEIDALLADPSLGEDVGVTEEGQVEDYGLDEGIPPAELFTGRGGTPEGKEIDLLDATAVPSGIDRRYGASRGSALADESKTTGYTPSAGETFTFDETGQMVVPSGRKV